MNVEMNVNVREPPVLEASGDLTNAPAPPSPRPTPAPSFHDSPRRSWSHRATKPPTSPATCALPAARPAPASRTVLS